MSIKEWAIKVTQKLKALQDRDYITEQGEIDGWTYRKWNSGIAECWKVWYSGTFAPTAQVNGFWYRVTNAESIPSGMFVGTPTGHFDLTYWGTGVFWGNVRNITSTTYRLTIFRNDNASSEGWGSISFKGRWK